MFCVLTCRLYIYDNNDSREDSSGIIFMLSIISSIGTGTFSNASVRSNTITPFSFLSTLV